MWAYPRENSAKEQMRLCYNDATNEVTRWDNSGITERFNQQKMYKKFVNATGIHDFVNSDNVDEWLDSLGIEEYE
jgi:hypothetical protein